LKQEIDRYDLCQRQISPSFALDKELVRITGVDFTRIDGINVMTAQNDPQRSGVGYEQVENRSPLCILAGPVPKQFRHRRQSAASVNRTATAFRIAASTLRRSDSYLGAQFRRSRTRLGAPKAITAMAHKLAVLFYRMLRYGQEYVDRGQQSYQDKYRQQQIALLNRQAAQLGLVVTPATSQAVSV
jgi:transposase